MRLYWDKPKESPKCIKEKAIKSEKFGPSEVKFPKKKILSLRETIGVETHIDHLFYAPCNIWFYFCISGP